MMLKEACWSMIKHTIMYLITIHIHKVLKKLVKRSYSALFGTHRSSTNQSKPVETAARGAGAPDAKIVKVGIVYCDIGFDFS